MWERRRDSKLEQTRKKLFDKLSRRLRSKDVVEAMKNVPRECFVPADDRHIAYLDIPWPSAEDRPYLSPTLSA